MYLCPYTHVPHTCMHTNAHAHTRTRTHTHTHTRTHTHIHTHAHTHAAVPLLSSTHTCPGSQYPFSCSACLSFSLLNSTHTAASQLCVERGGGLVTVEDETQWRMLLLYLESLNLSDCGVWLGYRYVYVHINPRESQSKLCWTALMRANKLKTAVCSMSSCSDPSDFSCIVY